MTSFKFIKAVLSNVACVRIAFALTPEHGSDREVGWSALEADRRAGRDVVYITSPTDFQSIATHFEINDNDVLNFGTVRVLSWPLELPLRLVANGYVRYFLWVVSLQLFLRSWCRGRGAKVHFVTYTQLATPILMPNSVHVYLGPVGIIPKVRWSAPVSRELALKSKIMWAIIMPLVRALSYTGDVKSSVVHPSIARSLGPNESRVISALNVDYLETKMATASDDATIDAIVVARSVSFKNLEIASKALRKVSAISGRSTRVINAGKQADFAYKSGAFVEVGRQDRATVMQDLKASRLHVTLSVELGGYINLEAATQGVPTLCLRGYGASFMLNPSDRFLLNIESMTPDYVADRVLALLNDERLIAEEAVRQRHFAQFFLETNRDRYEHWLAESGVAN